MVKKVQGPDSDFQLTLVVSPHEGPDSGAFLDLMADKMAFSPRALQVPCVRAGSGVAVTPGPVRVQDLKALCRLCPFPAVHISEAMF